MSIKDKDYQENCWRIFMEIVQKPNENRFIIKRLLTLCARPWMASYSWERTPTLTWWPWRWAQRCSCCSSRTRHCCRTRWTASWCYYCCCCCCRHLWSAAAVVHPSGQGIWLECTALVLVCWRTGSFGPLAVEDFSWCRGHCQTLQGTCEPIC